MLAVQVMLCTPPPHLQMYLHCIHVGATRSGISISGQASRSTLGWRSRPTSSGQSCLGLIQVRHAKLIQISRLDLLPATWYNMVKGRQYVITARSCKSPLPAPLSTWCLVPHITAHPAEGKPTNHSPEAPQGRSLGEISYSGIKLARPV